MKERGILMFGPNVKPTMDGSKTHTRRTLKIQPGSNVQEIDQISPGVFRISGDNPTNYDGNVQMNDWSFDVKCPYGAAGDRLWVRETFAHVGNLDPGFLVFRATYPDDLPANVENIPPASKVRWTPSIFMRRKYSRILLEITEVRVERLQDISEEDAKAEGCSIDQDPYWTPSYSDPDSGGDPSYIKSYQWLWESINGAGSWELNPYVWVIVFKRIK